MTYPIAFIVYMPDGIPINLKVMYTRPVVMLTSTFQARPRAASPRREPAPQARGPVRRPPPAPPRARLSPWRAPLRSGCR